MSEPSLAVDGLSVVLKGSRRNRTLVRSVSFELAPGETLGLVGESGSGKSLTARALVDLLPAGIHASGSATFDGKPLIGAGRRHPAAKLRGSRISLLLQDPFTMLNPVQTALTTVVESLPRGSRRDRRVEAARRLAEVGIDAAEAGNRYPFQLSGGMCQRVALAAALARDPELLIADEPTTAVDVTTQAEILTLLSSLREQRGMSMLLITHDLSVAFSVADRVLVMYAGEIVEDAPAAELSADPAHPYSLGLLLAEPPVSHYVSTFASIPGSVPSPDDVLERCAFANRCEWAAPSCLASHPELGEVEPGRTSACIRADEIRSELRRRRERFEVSAEPPAAPQGAPLLAVTDLVKAYRSKAFVGKDRIAPAVRGVSLQLGAGESVGLVGETGSGKTTIARCILGLATPDAGTVALGGIDISDFSKLGRADLRSVRRLVQVVFQDPYASLNPALTVGTVIGEAVGVRGDAGDPTAEVADLLELVGLPSSYAARRPDALSGGERQRVAIARAVAVRPRLLVCDEPVSSLDVSVQAQILELLREIRRRQGMAMLFITHDLSVVRQMTERVIVLYQGKVVESGGTEDVLDSPRDPYTARLLESIPSPPSVLEAVL
jgi:peptide/nickel transport system ATP-binding protein